MVASTSFGSVEYRFDHDVRRKRSSNVVDFRIDGGGNGAAVRPDQHQSRADDDFVSLLARATGPSLGCQSLPLRYP